MSIEQRLAELERRVRELEARENLAFNATNITGGTLSTDRFSAYADLGAESRIGLVTDRLPTADQVRGITGFYTVAQDWTSTTLPGGWDWAGSPFVTPPSTAVQSGTILYATGYTTASRSFLYRNLPSAQTSFAAGLLLQGNNNIYVGIRLDDGTDNNYAETVLRHQASDRQLYVTIRTRTGGGSVSELNPANMTGAWMKHPYVALALSVGGTLWSNWNYQPNLVTPYGAAWPGGVTVPTGLTWTPNRLGIVIQSANASWERFGVDWTSF